MFNRAFSLIELMVVVAIVAILSFYAVPAYRNYIDRAKLNSIMPVIMSWKDSALIYKNKHEYFPDASQLNLNDPLDGNTIDLTRYDLDDIITVAYMTGYTISYSCNGSPRYVGLIQMGLNPAKFSQPVDWFSVYYGIVEGTNTIVTGCSSNYMSSCKINGDNLIETLCPP